MIHAIRRAPGVLNEKWKTSTGFMIGRPFRLGPVYRAMAMVADGAMAVAARRSVRQAQPPPAVKSIFVLRNNDIGDTLVTTPLFDALRRTFPSARIVAGVGAWSLPLLEHNPHLSEVVRFDAPWFNNFTPSRSVAAALRFIYRAPESRALRGRHFDVGIDVLGSHFGTLLLMRADIPCRVGVRGYAGGEAGRSLHVDHSEDEPVSREILRLAEVLGAQDLPAPRPQIFLSPAERDAGEAAWGTRSGRAKRVILAPGGKPSKVWPAGHWIELVRQLAGQGDASLAIVGGKQDVAFARRLRVEAPAARLWAGEFSLRQTCGVVAAADAVICNDSMMTHLAAAFTKPTAVLLGASYVDPEKHARIWGYPPPCRMLSRRDASGEAVVLPSLVLDWLNHCPPAAL